MAPIQYKWCGYKEGKLETEVHTGKSHVTRRQRWDDADMNQGTPTTVGKSSEVREDARNQYSSKPSTAANTCTFSLPPAFSGRTP